jgi:hypothetical protein
MGEDWVTLTPFSDGTGWRLALSHQDVISSVTPPDFPGATGSASALAPRWLVILAWSTGLAAIYALASLAHASLVERILSVDVGFGRILGFWIGAICLALLAWGFLPAQPVAWYARRRPVLAVLAVGLVGAAVSGAFTFLWLMDHWVPAVGVPVTASIVALLIAAVGVLWLAARDERTSPPPS